MTSRVTAHCSEHAKCKVLMNVETKMPDGSWLLSRTIVVEPGHTGEIYIWDTQRVMIEEDGWDQYQRTSDDV